MINTKDRSQKYFDPADHGYSLERSVPQQATPESLQDGTYARK